MIITRAEALELKSKCLELAREIDQVLLQDEKNLMTFKTQKLCDHEWHKFTTAEIRKLGGPSMHSFMTGWNGETIKKWYMLMAGRCEKCGLPYKYQSLTAEDFDKMIEKYKSKSKINLTFSVSCDENLYDRAYQAKSEQFEDMKEEVEKMGINLKELFTDVDVRFK